MKRIVTMLIALAICLPAGLALGQGRGSGPMMEKVLKERVGLSDGQIKKIQDLQYKADREKIDIHHELQKARLDLEQMMRADKPDHAKVLGQVDRIGGLETALKKNRVGLMLQIRGLVTTEQWQKMESMHAERKIQRKARRARRRFQGSGWGGPPEAADVPGAPDAPDAPPPVD